MAAFEDVPDEIIERILEFVAPEENLSSIQYLSRRFNHVANEAHLWRHYCLRGFQYWQPEHSIEDKFASQASSVNWKGLWLTRKRRNVKASALLDEVLASKVGQLGRLRQICQLGYDAKDFLIRELHSDESKEDVLARRYYANAVLGSIHRGIAVEVWSTYRNSPLSTKHLDRALGAFDMFVLYDQKEDIEWISRTLDSVANDFRKGHPTFGDLTTREQALALVRWLRANNLMGMTEERKNYRNLRNNLIGHALSENDHQSLPIISSALFCCVAERLAMTSSCVSIPSHVHAAVFAPPGFDLDGKVVEDQKADVQPMYLNPYGSDDEVRPSDLRSALVEFGWSSETDQFLKASPVPLIVMRTAQNIKATYSQAYTIPNDENAPETVELKRLRTGLPELNLESAAYAAMWADIMMKDPSDDHWDANLDPFLNRFALSFSEDSWIVEKHLLERYDAFVRLHPQPHNRSGWNNVRDILGMLVNLDTRQPKIHRRYTEEIKKRVRFRIGQVFRHKRYRYIGIINGWAAGGADTLPTPHYSSPTELDEEENEGNWPGGRRPIKVYYTCLRSGVDRLRVAQENLEIITDSSRIPEGLFFLAGKFFKRFDKETCTFISNIKEFYPDD